MSSLRLLGKNAGIYTLAAVLQRGIGFILLPLYTRVLDAGEYGTLTLITTLSASIGALLSFALHGAIARYWFTYHDEPAKQAAFTGSTFVLMSLLSVLGGGLLILGRDLIFPTIVPGVPFVPYVLLGVLIGCALPVTTAYVGLLQTRGEALRCATLSLTQFLIVIVGSCLAVTWLRTGAEGPLVAQLVGTTVTLLYAAREIVSRFPMKMRSEHVSDALTYSLPLVPHTLLGQVQALSDRFLVNSFLGAASVGIYAVGLLLGGALTLLTDSANRAFVPFAMKALTDKSETALRGVRNAASTLICVYCLIAASFAFFASEAVQIVATAGFAGAALPATLIVFSCAASGCYAIFVNILFFVPGCTKLVFMTTLTASVINISLNVLLLPRLGITGAAVSVFVSQIMLAVSAAVLGRPRELVRWPYGRYLGAFGISFAIASIGMCVPWPHVSVKILCGLFLLATLYVALNLLFWGEGNYLVKQARGLLASRS